MKKGIVMEIEEKFLTVLTPDGQFLQAKKQKNCILGEEIIFTPLKQHPLNRLMGIKQLSAAAAILLILLGSLIPWYQNDKAYAYMSIDGNPSLEIGINNNMQVVKLTPFNHNGRNIISHIGSWKKENITLITESILKEMKKQGYLKKYQSVIISTIRVEKPEEKTEKQLTINMNKIKKFVKEINLKPIIIKGTKQDLEKAHRLGMTAGKYTEKSADATFKKDNQPTAMKQKADKNEIKLQGGTSNNKSDKTAGAAGVQKTKVENSGTTNNENTIPVITKQKDTGKGKQKTPKVNVEKVKTKNKEKSKANNGQMKKHENSENNHHEK